MLKIFLFLLTLFSKSLELLFVGCEWMGVPCFWASVLWQRHTLNSFTARAVAIFAAQFVIGFFVGDFVNFFGIVAAFLIRGIDVGIHKWNGTAEDKDVSSFEKELAKFRHYILGGGFVFFVLSLITLFMHFNKHPAGDLVITPLDLVTDSKSGKNLFAKFNSQSNAPFKNTDLMLLGYYMMKENVFSTQIKEHLFQDEYSSFLVALAIDNEDRKESAFYKAITKSYNDDDLVLLKLKDILKGAQSKNTTLARIAEKILKFKTADTSKMNFGEIDPKYHPLVYRFLLSNSLDKAQDVKQVIQSHLKPQNSPTSTTKSVVDVQFAVSAAICGVPVEMDQSPRNSKCDYAYFYWALKDLLISKSISIPLKNLPGEFLEILKEIAIKSKNIKVLSNIDTEITARKRRNTSLLLSKEELNVKIPSDNSSLFEIIEPTYAGYLIFYMRVLLQNDKAFITYFSDNRTEPLHAAIFMLSNHSSLPLFQSKSNDIVDMGHFWRLWSLFIHNPPLLKSRVYTDFMNAINQMQKPGSHPEPPGSLYFFGPLDTSFKLVAKDERFIFLLRTHLILNNPTLFANSTGIYSIYDTENIPFYPLIHNHEKMFFGSKYSPDADTRPQFENTLISQAADCINVIVNNKVNDSSAPAPAQVRPPRAPEANPVDYASYWNTALMWMSRKADYLKNFLGILPKYDPQTTALFLSAVKAMNPVKEESFMKIASNRIDNLASAILGQEKTTHLPIYQLAENFEKPNKMIPLLGQKDVLKEENAKLQEILLSRMLSTEGKLDSVYLLPYAMKWKDPKLRSALLQGLKKLYNGLTEQNAVLCDFRFNIFYFFYFAFEEMLTDKIPVEFYSLVECLESQALVYLHYKCINNQDNIKIFEDEIVRRHKLGDEKCTKYVVKA